MEPVPPAPPMPEMTAVSSVPQTPQASPMQPTPGMQPSPFASRPQLKLRDPSVVFRIVIVVLSAISVILLIAGTAVDEYFVVSASGKTVYAMGCQKYRSDSDPRFVGFSYRAPFKYMNTLSFVIIFFTSILCALQAAMTALNALALLPGRNGTPALISSSVLTFLLLIVVIMANVNFTVRNSNYQMGSIVHSPEYELAKAEYLLNNAVREIEDPFNNYGRKRERDMGRDPTGPASIDWGASYGLLCSAFAFAVLNQILIISIHLMSKTGVTTFGPLKDKIVSTLRDRTKLLRLVTTFLTALMLLLMVLGTAVDRYASGMICATGTRLSDCFPLDVKTEPFKIYDSNKPEEGGMYILAMILLILTSLVCVLQAVSLALCVFQLVKDKVLILPLIGLSGFSTVLLLTSLILACLNFTVTRYPNIYLSSWGISFNCVAASFAFGIINTALHVLNMVLAKQGGALFSRFTKASMPGQAPAPPPTPDCTPSAAVAEQTTQPVSAMPEQTTQQPSAS